MVPGKLFKVGYNCVAYPYNEVCKRRSRTIQPIALKKDSILFILSVDIKKDFPNDWIWAQSTIGDSLQHGIWLALLGTEIYYILVHTSSFTDITPFLNDKGEVEKYFDENMNLVYV